MTRTAVLLLAVALLLAACGSDSGGESAGATESSSAPVVTATGDTRARATREPTPTFAPTSTPTATTTATVTPTLGPTPAPVGLSGSGDATTPPTPFHSGLAIVTLHHYGSKRFVVNLSTAAGEGRGQLANDTAAFQGSRAIVIPEDEDYVFEVSADGAWDITVAWPNPRTGPQRELPLELSGTGVQAIYFVRAEPGLHEVQVSHRGSKAFVVSVMNSDGKAFDRLVEAEGAYEGTASVRVRGEQPSWLVVDIRADGDWTISID